MAQQNLQIVRHTVRQGDTLERLAEQSMGDASNWLQLAILNSLEYPYITDDEDFDTSVAATGTVRFSRVASSTGDITIPADYVVSVAATSRSPQKDYTVDTTTTLPDGEDTVEAAITAVVEGEIGNTPALTVVLLSDAITDLDSVVNLDPITGGETLTVLKPGDTILLLANQEGLSGTAGIDTQALQGEDFFTALLGSDIALDRDGDLFANARGGLATVTGVANFQAAVSNRLHSRLGWYPFTPDYGSNIEQVVGQRGDRNSLQRARIEAERTLRGDPRVVNLQNIKATFQSGTLALTFDVLMLGEKSPRNLVVALRPVNGG